LASSIVSRPVAGVKLDGTLRVSELVQTLSDGAGAVAAREIVTRRVARVQCTHSWAEPAVLANTASLPSLADA
jgi:hypothetical protein